MSTKSNELLDIETELAKQAAKYYEQEYIPHPTVEAAVESVTLVGESLYSWQTMIFVQEVVNGLNTWIENQTNEELRGLVSNEVAK